MVFQLYTILTVTVVHFLRFLVCIFLPVSTLRTHLTKNELSLAVLHGAVIILPHNIAVLIGKLLMSRLRKGLKESCKRILECTSGFD